MIVSPGLSQRQHHRAIGLRARMRLDVGEAAAEQLLGALDRQRLDLVRRRAALIVALARIAFGIFVGEAPSPAPRAPPCETMFSDAISSICVCSRSSSCVESPATTAGSASARLRVKKPSGSVILSRSRSAAVASCGFLHEM